MPKPLKRTATTELNRDNWDQEDEPEEAGTFKSVGQEELSKRVIKVARRRLREDRPLLSNFTGFGKPMNSVPDVKSTFSFLSNVNGSHDKTTSQTNPVDSSKDNEEESKDTKVTKENEYLANIKCLNECLLEWIQTCIKKNPSCILTPIFRDYEKHLESLKPIIEKSQELKPSESTSSFKFNLASSVNSQTSSGITPSAQPITAFTSISNSTTGTSGSWLSSSPVCQTNVFTNLSSTSDNKPAAPVFSFMSNPSSVAAPQSESTEKDEDGEETPVNDFKPVTEEDALYSQRVKVFFKNGKEYSDRGVGTLFIKEAKDSQGNKVHQAIVRADTNLGNILLNIRITPELPSKRIGKNNVMVVSPSDPNSKTKDSESKTDSKAAPVPVLLRVKTSEEADLLLNEINKYK